MSPTRTTTKNVAAAAAAAAAGPDERRPSSRNRSVDHLGSLGSHEVRLHEGGPRQQQQQQQRRRTRSPPPPTSPFGSVHGSSNRMTMTTTTLTTTSKKSSPSVPHTDSSTKGFMGVLRSTSRSRSGRVARDDDAAALEAPGSAAGSAAAAGGGGGKNILLPTTPLSSPSRDRNQRRVMISPSSTPKDPRRNLGQPDPRQRYQRYAPNDSYSEMDPFEESKDLQDIFVQSNATTCRTPTKQRKPQSEPHQNQNQHLSSSSSLSASGSASASLSLSLPAIRRQYIFERTKFHDCILAHDWMALDKLLHKFHRRYYQRQLERAEKKRRQQQQQQQQQLQQQQAEHAGAVAAAAAATADAAFTGAGDEGGGNSSRSITMSPMKIPASLSSDQQDSLSSSSSGRRQGRGFWLSSSSTSPRPLSLSPKRDAGGGGGAAGGGAGVGGRLLRVVLHQQPTNTTGVAGEGGGGKIVTDHHHNHHNSMNPKQQQQQQQEMSYFLSDEMVSPLLKVDDEGRTPLHLAILHHCPEETLLHLLEQERQATKHPDHLGQLPLHLAALSSSSTIRPPTTTPPTSTPQLLNNATNPTAVVILQTLVKAHPNALKTKDLQNRSPIGVAIETVVRLQDFTTTDADIATDAAKEVDPPSRSSETQFSSTSSFHWRTIPRDIGEQRWQRDQLKLWSNVDTLLKELMKRKKSLIPSEHKLLLQALEAGAPPEVIHRLISTTDKYLRTDEDFAGTALVMCVQRQYPLDTFGCLVDRFGNTAASDARGTASSSSSTTKSKSTILFDYTQKALTTHYQYGCQQPLTSNDRPTFGKEILEWNKAIHMNRWKEEPKKAGVGSDLPPSSVSNRNTTLTTTTNNSNGPQDSLSILEGVSPQCKEWWKILRYMLFFAVYGKDAAITKQGTDEPQPSNGELSSSSSWIQDYHMVHAALAIPTTQPSLVQLLLSLYPQARTEFCPTYKALPIHIACTRWRYDVVRNDMDSSMEKVVKTFLKADPKQIVRRYKGRLPLHMALLVGQSWTFVKPFISFDKISIGMRDPHTKLFPFQLAALQISSTSLVMLLRKNHTPGEWRTTSTATKKDELTRAREVQDRRQIGTIYELLRRYPDAIKGEYLVRDSVKTTVNIKGAGPVSLHYLNLVYHHGTTGWRLNPTNVKPLRASIVNGQLAKPLKAWWDRLRSLIWQQNPSSAIPADDDYLLHATLYNSDTPPTIVELLLALHPLAATRPIPGTQIYPLHIAAGTAAYYPQQFEVPYVMDSLQLTLYAYREATCLRVNGQLPLHMCLSRGKTWKEVQHLVKEDKKTLLVADPISKLAPFELMAAFKISSANNILRFASMAEKQTRNVDMHTLSVGDRAIILRAVKRQYGLDVLSTIYELLRQAPTAMTLRKVGRGSTTSGMIPSAVSSATTDSSDSQPTTMSGNMVTTLDANVNRVAVRSHVPSMGPQKIPSLASFWDGSRLKHDASLSSSGSLISRNSGVITFEDSYIKPVYDDDVISNMGASSASSLVHSPSNPMGASTHSQHSHSHSTRSSNTPSSSTRRMPKGQSRLRSRLPKVPNLDQDA